MIAFRFLCLNHINCICRSGGEKASSASSSTTAVSAVVSPKPVAAAAVAAAAAIPITPITRTPPADHCKPVLKVKPKKASIPPPLPPRKFPRDEGNFYFTSPLCFVLSLLWLLMNILLLRASNVNLNDMTRTQGT